MDQAVVQTDVDKYIIVEYIAEGGMGAIFRGKKVGLVGFEKEVVLKQLLPEFTSQPEFIDLFLREAKLSAALDHANIVHTIDLVAADRDYFIVMEYVRGGDLRNIQRRIKQLSARLQPAAALFIAREMLSALAYAHEKCTLDGRPLQLIHRDVSPSNIMISASGEVKLADFGIAKASTHKSVFYRVKGKVGYMSPEQARGETLDHRSDLYSLAVCLYEMLSSERLFVADLMSTAEQIYNQPIQSLESLPDIPRGIDAVLAKALAKDRDARYQTAHELQDALVQLSYDSGIVFTAPDLAEHLRQVCGPDPSSWNKELAEEQQEPAGTQVLAEELSKVELTSVFTQLPEAYSANEVDEDEATHHIRFDPRDIAFDPTRIQESPLSAARARDRSAEPLAAAAVRGTISPAEEQAWEHSSQNLSSPDRTVAVHGEIWQPPANDDAYRPAAETTDLGPPRLSSEQELEPAPAAARTALPLNARGQPYSRRGMVAASLVLLLLSGIIVLVIGLTGPDLESARSAAVLTPDLESVPDLKPPAPAPAAPVRPALTPPAGASPPPQAARADSAQLEQPAPPQQEEPDERLGRLEVSSTPPGATVYLDGSRQCRTPCGLEKLQRQKIFLLSVRRTGYSSWSSLVELKEQKTATVKVDLQKELVGKNVGFLLIRARPRAEVFVDGKEIGRVTSEGRIPLRPGRYEIMLTHPHKRRRPRYKVTIRAKKLLTLRSRL